MKDLEKKMVPGITRREFNESAVSSATAPVFGHRGFAFDGARGRGEITWTSDGSAPQRKLCADWP